jgi:hypothetical protein
MTDKMRDEFEAWAIASGEFTDISRSPDLSVLSGIYLKPRVQLSWCAWQASRKSLTIKLQAERKIRHQPRIDENTAYNEAIENCRDSIEAAGLTVKNR